MTSAYRSITLDEGEFYAASQVGLMRQLEAIRQSRPERHGAKIEDRWGLHIEGAAGEMAVAKARGCYWGAPINTYKVGGDVGEIQVRTRSRHDYELIIRKDDRDSDWFVLVTGRLPHFRVWGWIKGGDAKRPEWLKTHGGREAAYFVPHEALTQFRAPEAGRAA